MKTRALKLKEAHKSNGSSSLCSILWDLESHHLVTASSSDLSISIHDLLPQNPKPPKTLRHHKDGVTAVALSPNSTCLASGSLDHCIKLYKFPSGDFQHNVTRFTLPIRSLAFNKSGTLLAAAGDDEGIKLIATIDGSISRVLKGHKGSVTGLAFDPTGEYLASVDGIGTVIYWELSSGKPIHTLKGIAPDSGSDDSVLNIVSWSPDGEMLAVPGLRNDVVMYDRDTAEKLFSLKGDHIQSVCFLSWSPNGKYMATSGLDRQVLIWDVDQRQDIDRQKFDDRICCLAWKPNGNALAVIDVMGRFGVWESVIPLSMKSPTDGASSLQSRSGNGLLLFDEDDEEPSNSGSLSDIGEDSYSELAPVTRKRLRKQSSFGDNSDEDGGRQEDSLPRVEKFRKKAPAKLEENFDSGKAKEGIGSLVKFGRSNMQEPFQPGSTPVQAGKRRFLCYNILGSVTTIENDGHSHIEVDFHDTGRGPRVPSMTDYFGFTMASLNECGSVFANPCKGDKNMSTLMYRPFTSWANNSEWSMRFEAEEVKVVALGAGWIAAVTSLNFLRIFTEGGLQKHILSLDGPVVTAAGFKDELAIVIHSSDCLPSGDQMLEFIVFNIHKGTQPIRGRLPLTPASCLTWFGFSEEGHLSSYDSKGVLRVFTNQCGGSWLPMFSASKERKSEEENYWVVGLNASKLFCIVCKAPDSFPLPVLTLLSLSMPLASSDLGADELENEFIMTNLYLSQAQNKIEEMAAAGLDTTALDDEAFNVEAAQDRCILRLIASCCNGDKLVRAVELARLLSLEKSLKGAIKLVTALKLPILAEQFNGILEERLLGAIPGPSSVSAIANGVEVRPSTHAVENNRASEPSNPLPPPKLPPPQFSKQEKSIETAKIGDIGPSKKVNMGSTKDDKLHRATNPFTKSLKNCERLEEKSKTGEKIGCEEISMTGEKIGRDGNTTGRSAKEYGNQIQSHRPTNPFAKSSNNQDNSSLLDSLKKMKRDNEGKDKAGVTKR